MSHYKFIRHTIRNKIIRQNINEISFILHCESKKNWATFFTAYNFRNIEQIFTK